MLKRVILYCAPPQDASAGLSKRPQAAGLDRVTGFNFYYTFNIEGTTTYGQTYQKLKKGLFYPR